MSRRTTDTERKSLGQFSIAQTDVRQTASANTLRFRSLSCVGGCERDGEHRLSRRQSGGISIWLVSLVRTVLSNGHHLSVLGMLSARWLVGRRVSLSLALFSTTTIGKAATTTDIETAKVSHCQCKSTAALLLLLASRRQKSHYQASVPGDFILEPIVFPLT